MTFMLKDNRLVVDIPGTKSRVKPSVIPVRKGGLARVRVAQHPDKVRVVLDLTNPLEYTVTPEGNTLVIAMRPVSAAKPEANAPSGTDCIAGAGKGCTNRKRGARVSRGRSGCIATHDGHARRGRNRKSNRWGHRRTRLLAGGSKFTGRKISLDLQDADLINVMRLFAEVANLNIILSPEVKGRVTVRMVNIPWDQAMDIILKMNGLGYVLEDNILRIASVGALTKEAEDDMRSKEAKKKAEDLITRIIPVNYAKAGEIEPTIKKSLSPRGETVTDTRTNTLIIKDIARNVDEVVSLIKLLDKPIAQIMIEARIVEASLIVQPEPRRAMGWVAKAGCCAWQSHRHFIPEFSWRYRRSDHGGHTFRIGQFLRKHAGACRRGYGRRSNWFDVRLSQQILES